MTKYEIQKPAVPQLRIFTAGGPVALWLQAYRIESDQIVTYIAVDSDEVVCNLGPCSIANSVGPSFNANQLDIRINANKASNAL